MKNIVAKKLQTTNKAASLVQKSIVKKKPTQTKPKVLSGRLINFLYFCKF